MFKQETGITISIKPVPYLENLFLYFCKSKYALQLICKRYRCSYKFHGRSRFMDGLCTTNVDGVFSSSCKHLHPKQLELKLEHQEEHVTFLDFCVTIEDNTFVYNLFEKGTSLLSLLYVCLICRIMLHHQCSMD